MNRPYPRKVHAPPLDPLQGNSGIQKRMEKRPMYMYIRATVLAYVAAHIHTHTHTSYLSAIKYSGARKTPTRSGEAKNNKQRVRTDDLHA